MRVAIVSRGEFPGFDGPARRVKYIGAGLVLNGCDVTLIVGYPPGRVRCTDTFQRLYGYKYYHAIDSKDNPRNTWRNAYYKVYGTLKSYWLVRKLNADKRFDVIFVFGVGLLELLGAWFTAKGLGLKIVVDKNDVNYRLKTRYWLNFEGILSGINIALGDWLMVKCADIIFTVSSFLYERYAPRANGRVRHIIPSMVDHREVASAVRRDDLFSDYEGGFRIVTSVTTPYHLYGFRPFAKALQLLRNECRFGVYVITSDGGGSTRYLDEVLDENRIQDITKVMVRVSPDLIPSLYASADIILNCQQEPAIAVGGFPGKTAEILAAERPIITTVFGDLSKYYVHQKNCLVVSYNHIDSYLQAFRSLFESRNLREALGREARKTAFEFFEYKAGTKRLADDITEMLAELAVRTE